MQYDPQLTFTVDGQKFAMAWLPAAQGLLLHEMCVQALGKVASASDAKSDTLTELFAALPQVITAETATRLQALLAPVTWGETVPGQGSMMRLDGDMWTSMFPDIRSLDKMYRVLYEGVKLQLGPLVDRLRAIPGLSDALTAAGTELQSLFRTSAGMPSSGPSSQADDSPASP